MSKHAKRVAAGVLATLWLAGAAAAADDTQLKMLMGDNFGRAGSILTDLIAARYQALPQKAEAIRQHAVQLIEKPPSFITGKEGREQFTTFATFLKNSAQSLEEVTTQLAKRDQEHAKTSGELSVDYLRVAAAEHFGNMITACVLCHNQFRRHALPQ